MFKPLTILPVALSSVFGRARKTGRWRGGSARVTMSFWNGVNGSRRRSRSIAQRDLMFRLTREEGPDWRDDRSYKREQWTAMRAVRLVHVGKPLENAELAVPKIGPSDVLIRIEAAGICRSDEHYRAGISKIENLPLTLGHEVAGTVERAGADVANLAPGD